MSAAFCSVQLNREGDQDDILAGLLTQQLLQFGDLGQSLGIAAQFSILHGAVGNQSNFLAGLGSQFLFQGGDGFQQILSAVQVGVVHVYTLLISNISIAGARSL